MNCPLNYLQNFTNHFYRLVFFGCLALSAQGQSWVRINQLGYLEDAKKVAVLVSKGNTSLQRFEVIAEGTMAVVLRSNKVRSYDAYGPFRSTFRLDFSSLRRPGSYFIRVGDVRSPTFRISNNVYNGTADFVLKYMRQQRSKYNPFLKDSCHTADGYIIYHSDSTKNGKRIDVAGGWHDASDYLQYLPTSANATFQMLFAYLQNPGAFGDEYDSLGNAGSNGIPDILDEAAWGIAWMVKMNPGPKEFYTQIADDRDHRGLRLPNKDSVIYDSSQGLARPVYFLSGNPQGLKKYQNKTEGVSSSAGKFASAFALGSTILRKYYPALADTLRKKALDAYEFAKTKPGFTQTAPCGAPYYYAEENFNDDMELAALAISLFDRTGKLEDEALTYAKNEPVTPWMGADTAHHYQWYPFVNLGHYLGVSGKDSADYRAFMKEGIRRVVARGKNNAFLNGVPFIWCSNNLVAAILTQIDLYTKTSGSREFDEEKAAYLDWLFGCNPWGTSMICDLPEDGDSPVDPHSAFTKIGKYKISGGLVDGPIYGSIWGKLIGVNLSKPDDYADFQSGVGVYHDDYADYSTNEPTMDGTASLSYILSSLEMAGKAKTHDALGALIKKPSEDKKVYLIFSGHDFNEGGEFIRDVLEQDSASASFFFTGDFLRNRQNATLIKTLKGNNHYIGIHSDKHLLYADWKKRDSTLVTRGQFDKDLEDNQKSLGDFGIKKGAWFLPAFEWYNRDIVQWASANQYTLINFTPGTATSADYTDPSMPGYVSSETLINKLLQKETGSGLNGAFILIHLGTDPKRKDKLYLRLSEIIAELRKRGYSLARLP